MKILICTIAVVALGATGFNTIGREISSDAVITAPAQTQKEQGSILGTELKIIQAALPEFEKHDIKMDLYRITVIKNQDSFSVLFQDPERPVGLRGSSPRIPEFEVLLNAADLKVIQASFVR